MSTYIVQQHPSNFDTRQRLELAGCKTLATPQKTRECIQQLIKEKDAHDEQEGLIAVTFIVLIILTLFAYAMFTKYFQ